MSNALHEQNCLENIKTTQKRQYIKRTLDYSKNETEMNCPKILNINDSTCETVVNSDSKTARKHSKSNLSYFEGIYALDLNISVRVVTSFGIDHQSLHAMLHYTNHVQAKLLI